MTAVLITRLNIPDEIINYCVIPNDRVRDDLQQGDKLRVNVILFIDSLD